VEAFKEILTLYPNSSYAVDAQFALSKCYIAQGNYQSAGEELQRFIQYFPGSVQSAEAYFLLGVVYYQLESYLSAIDYFNKVITDYTDSDFYGPALKNSAWCYDRLQDNPKALQAFSTYLKQYPKAEDNQQIELQMARLQSETGSTKEAITRFEGLQKSSNLEVALEACYRLGMLQVEQKQMEKAERAFRLAANLNGADNYYRLSALAQLAAIYENRGEAQKAINTYEILASSTSEERWTTAAHERINMLQLQQNQTTE
jgi:TolA-binding protein